MSLRQRMTKGVLASSAGFGVSLLTALVQIPLLLFAWGADLMGVWLALQTVQTLASGLDVAHHTYIGNKINQEYSKDRDKALNCLGSALRVGALTGLLPVAVLGVCIAMLGDFRGILGIDPTQTSLADCTLILVVFLATWALTLSPGGLVTKIYVARGDFARMTVCGVIFRLLSLASLAGSVTAGAGLVGTAVAQAVTTLVFHAWQFIDVKRRYPEDFPWWRYGSLRQGCKTYVRALSLTVNQLGQNLLGNGLLLVVSRELGSVALPAFQAMRTLVNLAQTANSMLVNPLTPELGRMLATADREKSSKLLCQLQLASAWILGLALPLVIFIGPSIFYWWTSGKLAINENALYLLYIATCLRVLGSGLMAAYASANAVIPQIVCTWTNLLVTMFFSFMLVPSMQLEGVALAVMLGEFAGSIVISGRFHQSVGLKSTVSANTLLYSLTFVLFALIIVTSESSLWALQFLWLGFMLLFFIRTKVSTRDLFTAFPRLPFIPKRRSSNHVF